VVVPFLGPGAWFVLGTSRRPETSGRPIGPDDDPDFLRTLGQHREEQD
jgi:hypothetical protein